MANNIVRLADRIKETSHSTGTGNFRVDGAATGFSAFGDSYSYNSSIFYAITDGTDYEVGSGQYVQDGSNNAITRFPFKSSNSNNLVNFAAGVKEVFVTYPGEFSVFTSSGIGTFNRPVDSGIAFWGSRHVLDYNPNLIWNKFNNKLGIRTNDPQYALDIGGGTADSTLRSSGIIVGDSGVMFSGVTNVTGRQVDPFLKNVINSDTGANAVLASSGIVNEGILLTTQSPHTVFAGPSGSCAGGCAPDYPTFRYLASGDIPDLSFIYTKQFNDGSAGNVALYKTSGNLQYDSNFTWDISTDALDVDGSVDVSGTLTVSGVTTIGSEVVTSSGGTTGTNTIVNSSGLLRIPVYADVGTVISELPPTSDTSGVLVLGGSSLMICNGITWLSGVFS